MQNLKNFFLFEPKLIFKDNFSQKYCKQTKLTMKAIRYATQKDAKLICAINQAAYAGYRSLLPYSSVLSPVKP